MAENMKPSGIAWIGDIPESWEVKRVKFLITDIKDGTHGTFDRIDSGELLLSAKNVFDDKIIINENESEISQKDYRHIVSNGFPAKGDVLLCCVGTIGRTCVYQFEKAMAFQRSVAFLRHNEATNPYFLKYCLQSDSTLMQEKLLINKSAQDGLYMGSVKELIVSYTKNYQEQILIADFLDKQCAKIDSITADIEKQIELLEKYKKSLITETVTKGLNKKAPMKDSGIEWIGKIPQHWEVKRLKFVLSVSSGDAITNEELEDGEIPVYGGGKPMGYFNKSNVTANTALIGRVGANCGCVTLVDTSSWATDNALIVKTNYNTRYIYYLLLSLDLNKLNDANAQPLITGAKVGNCVSVIISSHDEQTQIADFLDKKCAQVNAIIETKKQQLELMQKHKQSMIYEYVTGKKRVTEVQS